MLLNKRDFEVKPKELLSARRQSKHRHLIAPLSRAGGSLAQEIPLLSFWSLVAFLRGQSQAYPSERFKCLLF